MAKKEGFKIFYALSIAWQLGFLIIVPIGGFFIMGLLLDRLFNTLPLILIIGLFLGIIITAYETYHLLIPLIKEND